MPSASSESGVTSCDFSTLAPQFKQEKQEDCKFQASLRESENLSLKREGKRRWEEGGLQREQ